VGQLGLGDGTFDHYMIYFSVVVPTLSLGIGFIIGATNDCKDCIVSWESFTILLWFLDFQQGWGWRTGFGCNKMKDFYGSVVTGSAAPLVSEGSQQHAAIL
jgi:hypothetical protein